MTTLQFYGTAASYITAARAHLESLGITTEPLDVLEPQLGVQLADASGDGHGTHSTSGVPVLMYSGCFGAPALVVPTQ